MKNSLIPATLSLFMLTGCDFSAGFLGLGGVKTAKIDLTMTALSNLKSVSAYRLQDVAAPPESSEPIYMVSDFTPDSYRAAIESIGLITTDGKYVRIYEGKEPLEFANREALEATLNASGLSVEEGTYVGASIRLGEVHAVKGEAKLGDLTLYTKRESSSDSTKPPAEHSDVMPARDRELFFAKPLTVTEGSNIKLSLVYDLTDSVIFTRPGKTSSARGSKHLLAKNIPFFAFVGEPPKPEIYKVRIPNSDKAYFAMDDNWHYQVVLFAQDDGELAGVQSYSRLDEGFQGSGLSVINFTDNKLDVHSRNPDGTYRLVGYYEGGAAIPMWELKSFKRETHSGKVLYFRHDDPSMTAPVELDYHAEKLN